MRSFIKLYGPPILKAIKALEKISLEMPEVCIMDTAIANTLPSFENENYVRWYFSPAEVPAQRCGNIISKSSELLGEYDFFFEWFTEPDMEQVNKLIEKIDEALSTLGCRYTIVTKR
ncbi:MAG: hypothetical protein ACUVV4_06930 [Candidatus Bathyarchaeia archaeon]